MATLITMTALGFAAKGILQDALSSMPIKYVRTSGVFQYLSKDEIRAVLTPLVATSFFAADMQAIQRTVADLPWVAAVRVKRVWPDAVDIKVDEQRPYVRWGRTGLLNERGDLFKPKNLDQFEQLPIVTGPEHQEKKVLEIMKGIRTELADHALTLAEFNINDRWAWSITLSTGMEIKLGRNGQLEKLDRFLNSLKVLGQDRIDSIKSVDLRYPNGYAVTWKPESPCCDWTKSAIAENPSSDKPKIAAQSKPYGKKNRT